jgi:TPP-dependent pyruvate/acetoin dehydrogenase alpha subunit
MPEHDGHGLGRAELHELYRALVVARTADATLESLHRDGSLDSFVAPPPGRSEVAAAAAFALRRAGDGTGDLIVLSGASAGAVFLFGLDLVDFFRQHLGRSTGPTRGRDVGARWLDLSRGFVGPLASHGTMIQVMAGVTLAMRLRGEDRVGVVFYGADASAAGAWHEGLNFAAAQSCPLVLVVENDEGEAGRGRPRSSRLSTFRDKGPGYGIGAESVDGADGLAVFGAVRRAARLARSGEGTRLVEILYPSAGEGVDPLSVLRRRMLDAGWATPEELDALESQVAEMCALASEQARSEPVPEGRDAVPGVYTDVALSAPWTRALHPGAALAGGAA